MIVDSKLIRLDLSRSALKDAFKSLDSRSVSGSSLFPGEVGLARSADDEARMARFVWKMTK